MSSSANRCCICEAHTPTTPCGNGPSDRPYSTKIGTLPTVCEIAVAVSRQRSYGEDRIQGSRMPLLASAWPKAMALVLPICDNADIGCMAMALVLPICDNADIGCMDCRSSWRHMYTLMQKSAHIAGWHVWMAYVYIYGTS